MAKIFAGIRRPSLRYGLIFGIILGIVQIAYGFVASFVTDQGAQTFLSTIGLVLFLIFGFLTGQRAARETGKLGTGVLAGLWAGLIGAALDALLPLINTIINLQSLVVQTQAYIKTHESQYNNMKPSDYTSTDVLIGTLIGLLFYILFYALLTLIGGAVGGYLGRRRALAAQDGGDYEEAMFVKPSSNDSVVDEAKK